MKQKHLTGHHLKTIGALGDEIQSRGIFLGTLKAEPINKPVLPTISIPSLMAREIMVSCMPH
jgi:hypothetical protein